MNSKYFSHFKYSLSIPPRPLLRRCRASIPPRHLFHRCRAGIPPLLHYSSPPFLPAPSCVVVGQAFLPATSFIGVGQAFLHYSIPPSLHSSPPPPASVSGKHHSITPPLHPLFLQFKTISIFAPSKSNRGALNNRAEIIPIEPDPGNAGEGNDGSVDLVYPLLIFSSNTCMN